MNDFMKRKVVKHGTATLTVSLPSKWVQKYNIKSGDELEVCPKGDTIIVSSLSATSTKSTEIKIMVEEQWCIDQILKNLYYTGYDEIKIIFSKSSTSQKIKNTLQMLFGFEVVDSSSNSCIVKDITSKSIMDFEVIVRKCFHTVSYEYDLLLESMKTNKDNSETIKNLNLEVYKFAALCERLLQKSTENNTSENKTSWYVLIEKLIKTSINCSVVSDLSKKDKSSKNVITYLEQVKSLFDFATTTFYRKAIDDIPKVNSIKQKLFFNNFYKQLIENKGNDNLLYFYLAQNVKLTPSFTLLPLILK